MELPSSPRIDGGIANEMRRRKLAQDRLKSVAISGLLGVVALGAMIWMGDQGEPGQGRSQGASSLSTSRSAALKRISIAHGQKLALTGLDGNSTDVQIGGEVAGGTSSNNTVGACTAIPAAIPVLSSSPLPFPTPCFQTKSTTKGCLLSPDEDHVPHPENEPGISVACMIKVHSALPAFLSTSSPSPLPSLHVSLNP